MIVVIKSLFNSPLMKIVVKHTDHFLIPIDQSIDVLCTVI